MRKLFLLALLTFPLFALAQNTVTLPSGTSSATPAFRVKGTLSDSLAKRYWIQFPGGSFNELYTATYINQYFTRKTQKDSAIFSPQFTQDDDSVIYIKDDTLTEFNKLALLSDSG